MLKIIFDNNKSFQVVVILYIALGRVFALRHRHQFLIQKISLHMHVVMVFLIILCLCVSKIMTRAINVITICSFLVIVIRRKFKMSKFVKSFSCIWVQLLRKWAKTLENFALLWFFFQRAPKWEFSNKTPTMQIHGTWRFYLCS